MSSRCIALIAIITTATMIERALRQSGQTLELAVPELVLRIRGVPGLAHCQKRHHRRNQVESGVKGF